MARASVKSALWSGVGDTKVAHLVLNLVAKKGPDWDDPIAEK